MTQVMIVEDDPMVRELNGQYLRRVLGADLTLREFGDAQSALDAYQSQPADLILLDVYMPTLSGAEMLQELTARNWHPQVIMLTAASDLGHVREALDYGCWIISSNHFPLRGFKRQFSASRRCRK